MMSLTTNLTKPISKNLLWAIIIVTIGAEVLLYLTRYSSLGSTLYDAVMVSSFFIGWKLYRRLSSEQEHRKSPRQIMLQFTGAFLIFFLGSTVVNVYSNLTFEDFNEDYDQYVQDYTESQALEIEGGVDKELPDQPIGSIFEKIDTIGYDLYNDTLAGLEEVWRLAYIILLLVIFKKVFPRRWESGRRDGFLMAALFITSILFGIDHTLDTDQPWAIRIGAIVTFANMGLLFGLILLWTRNLWLTVIVHAVYDITATLSWYYIDYAVEYFTLGVLIVHVCLYIFETIHQNRFMQQRASVQEGPNIEVTQKVE
ncbi:CPBP family intramembrane glutamic endopeptidase [Neobacillus sp. OS1-33]|uniref:CPBP family intramembrane glutamic endopeptidase n=1 Tax=Neobacillus sp. OS1-33 TaxID=3070683 RepID=UPI0027E0CF41|nr:CPBP family intramembrane glutamic endopeptidase [Neobacillus sp. OS1-33]WML24843.1 CPBP family intramembrane glutamic endopeptidase [Neobacillus sp. OS1-33]